MKPETRFRRRCVKWIKDTIKNVSIHSVQQLSISGEPDIFLCINGVFVAIEFKKSGKKEDEARPLQKHVLNKIEKRGKGLAIVAEPENWAQVEIILRQLDGMEPPWEKRLSRPQMRLKN